MNTKARYWWAVLYPDRMIDDWQNKAADILQLPFAYCIHDKDLLKESEEERITHIHFIIVFSNTTTFNHALETFNLLYKQDQPLKMIKQIINIRYAYNYLIHDTDTCREAGKHLYDTKERITGNNFDIGCYEQLGVEDKEKIINDIRSLIYDNFITNFADLDKFIFSNFSDTNYQIILRQNHNYFNSIIKGNYNSLKFKYETDLKRYSDLVSSKYKK